MLNIRSPGVMFRSETTGATTSDPDDLIVTSIVVRQPTDWSATNDTVGTYNDPNLISMDKTGDFGHERASIRFEFFVFSFLLTYL